MVGPLVTVEVKGAEQLRLLGTKLRVAGTEGKVLRRELLASMRAAAKPMADAAKAAAEEELPKGGGLNQYVADSRFAVRNRLTGFNAGVRISATKGKHKLKLLDQGTAYHPVFGNRKVWAENEVKAGWFTDTLQKQKPKVQIALLTAMHAVTRQIKE